MRLVPSAAVLALLLAAPAAAQTQAQTPASTYQPAPWWMREAVIAATGRVRTEVRANRANFAASFEAVARTSQEAAKAAADKVRALGEALRAYPADQVRVATTFSVRPLYEQYRDAEDRIRENQRPDQVERYAVSANVAVEVRDVALAERIYATVLAARPTSTQPVQFRLEPDNETRTELARLAAVDAARRAREAAEATGARLGPVKLIDPTGRACDTDVLVSGAPSGLNDSGYQDVALSARRAPPLGVPPPPPPPAPAAAPGASPLDPELMRLPLQPPLQPMTDSVCVVYGLGPG